MITQHRQQYT
ncbi:hypothetical protein YPPY14_3345, partial [Yersinia pestis PY-14]